MLEEKRQEQENSQYCTAVEAVVGKNILCRRRISQRNRENKTQVHPEEGMIIWIYYTLLLHIYMNTPGGGKDNVIMMRDFHIIRISYICTEQY